MNVTFHDLTTLKKTKEWGMIPKAQREFSRICRKLPFRVKINKVYLLDGKESISRVKNKEIKAVLSRSSVVALYNRHKNDLYLNVYDIVGDTYMLNHELAHAYDFQNNRISMKRTFVEAFIRDKEHWHEEKVLSGKRAENPFEFFADFVALYIADSREAREKFPNYYQTFKKELKL